MQYLRVNKKFPFLSQCVIQIYTKISECPFEKVKSNANNVRQLKYV